ncbi:MAG: 50S ribosomal protein L24e [Candidatus Helarchaeota archaeon]
MVKYRECSFCGSQIEPGTGHMYALHDGTVFYFCSSKCHKCQLKLKRNPRRLKWTKKYQKITRKSEMKITRKG